MDSQSEARENHPGVELEDGPPAVDGWATNERDRLVLGLDSTPAQRLAWLEEMIVLAYRTGALPKPDAEPTSENSGS